MPPSTFTYEPVMKEALSLARKSMTLAMSSGSAMRRRGCALAASMKSLLDVLAGAFQRLPG